ncbi:hypothetical protein CF327_g2907 [Tilletia walkeri]|nr:hypothetical protein CF327_g2907 [Tilletia walkeri]
MRGGVSSSSSMLALRKREHSFHNGPSQPPTPSTTHRAAQPPPPMQSTPHRTPAALMKTRADPFSPDTSSTSNSSIMSGIHSFNAPARSGVAGARRLPQFSMQPAPRARGAPSTTPHSAAAVPSRMSKGSPRKEGPRSSFPPAARRVLSPQTQHQQRHAIISRRPKKIFASVTSATSFYSTNAAAAATAVVATPAQPRSASFTFGAPGGVIPRSMPTPPSPGGSPDPIDAFSSPVPLRPVHVQASLARREEHDGSFADTLPEEEGEGDEDVALRSSVKASKSFDRPHKRKLIQIFESDEEDDDDDLPILKKPSAFKRPESKTTSKEGSNSASAQVSAQIHGASANKENEAKLSSSSRKPDHAEVAESGAQPRKRQKREAVDDGKKKKKEKVSKRVVEQEEDAAAVVVATADVGLSRESNKTKRAAERDVQAVKGKRQSRSSAPEKGITTEVGKADSRQPGRKSKDAPQSIATEKVKEKGKGKGKAVEKAAAPVVPPRNRSRQKESKVSKDKDKQEVQAAPKQSEVAEAGPSNSRPRRRTQQAIVELTEDEDEDDDDDEDQEDAYGEESDDEPILSKTRKGSYASSRSKQVKKVVSEDEEEEGEGGFGAATSNLVLRLLEAEAEEEVVILDPKAQPRLSAGKAKGVDKRSPVRRFLDLIAEIFDGEDALPATASSKTGMCAESAMVFSNLQGHLVLRMDVLHSLIRLIKLCKETPPAPIAPSAPVSEGGPSDAPEPEPQSIAKVEASELGRLLRILERTVRAADGTRPFAESREASKMKDKKAKSTSDENGSTSEVEASTSEPEEMPVDKKEKGGQYLELTVRLERIATGVLASECCFEIFSLDGLQHSLVSEDILQTCLDTLKLSVNDTILPFVEGCADLKTTNSQPLLRHFLQNLVPAPLKKKRGRQSKSKVADVKGVTAITGCGNQVTSVFVRTYAALGALHTLVNLGSIQLSESVLISAVYTSLGPFFAIEPEESSTKGNKGPALKEKKGGGVRSAIDAVGGASAMRSLRLPALHLLRSIFARHPEQRSWIIEEVLGSLGKLAGTKKMTRQIALRSGGSVNFLTTLLLHLVQSSAHGFREHVLSKEPVYTFSSPEKSPVSSKSEGGGKRKRSESPVKGGKNRKPGQAAMWSMSMESPLQTASTISAFIMQRLAAGKTTKSSNDTAYIPIVESLMSDLLETLFLPEWPGAAILLTRFCISFCSVLNDPQVGPEARGIAIEHLGAAASRLRACQTQLNSAGPAGATTKPKRLLRDIINESGELDSQALEQLQTSYVSLRNNLGRITDEDRAADSARELLEAQWVAETAAAMTKLSDNLDAGETQDADDQRALEALVEELKLAPKQVGKDLPRSDEITPTQYKQLTRTSHFVLSSSAFMVQYETLQDHLLDALDRQAVANRAKALRALSSVATVDGDLLSNEDVRWAVEAKLEDSSVGVREAAVGLLSRYVLQRPKEIDIHFEQLVHYIHDSGVSVRKRIVRLLADIYTTVSDKNIQAECCARLIRCVTDEDTGMQDLAVATIAKLWFEVSMRATDSKKGKIVAVLDPEEASSKHGSPAADNGAYIRHRDVITMVASMIRERPSPMEEVFSRMLQQCSEQDSTKLRNAYRTLSDSMIDAIVSEPTSSQEQAMENDPTSMFSRVKTIHLLVSTLPTVLTVNRGKALLPFLKSAQTDVEMQVLHLLLRVFSAALPSMPRTAIAFAQELERSLMPLINRPRFKSGSTALQELVACYVKVITLHTHNFSLMIKMFTQCYGRLQFVADHVSVAPKLQLEATNAILIALTTLLCEHADFDKLRETNPVLAPSINNLKASSVLESVYTMLVTIYQSEDPGYKAAALQSLGWLFRSYPSLMGRDDATRTMDEVLGTGDAHQRELLLRSMLEFLNGQQQTRSEEMAASKRGRAGAQQNDAVDMAQLVGDTAEFAESSVSSTLLQRYLDRILDASLSVRIPTLQRTALEILNITVLQGLTHPLQCVPTLIALETSADENVRSTAFRMHSHLAQKHGSILAARYLEHARVACNFQLSIKGADQLRGFRMEERPTAALQQWYSLVCEKRQTKLDFLKAMIRAFDIDRFEVACTMEHVAFARFMADNLALFDYTTNEEVMTIVGELRTILSVAGMQTYSAIDDELDERETELRNLSQGPQKKAPELWIEIEVSSRPKRSQPTAPSQRSEPAVSQPSSTSDKLLDKARELELARTSTILGFALLLRNQLKWLYTLSEARCAKCVPGKKTSAGADKPAVRRPLTTPSAAVLELSSLPGAFSSCEQSRDALLQMQAYHNAIAEEGSILEADEGNTYD